LTVRSAAVSPLPLTASVQRLAFLVGVIGVALTGLTIARRVASPWPLEWMEGASLQHALRLLHGQPLYAPPAAEFIPFMYPPLAYLPMAASAALFGPELWAARLVSVLALAGSFVCIFRSVNRETGSAAIGCWAVGIYALGFGYSGAFLDLVRVDGVFMLFVLLGLERLSAGAIGAGLGCLAASCLAKQHGGLFLIASAIWLVYESPRRHLVPLMAAGAALLAAAGWLELSSAGWFSTYVLRVPAGHGIEPQLLVSYLLVDVLVYLPALALFAALGMQRGVVQPRWWIWLAAGLLASALGRAHPGGDDNVRLPGFALLVMVAAIAFPQLWAAARNGTQRALYAAALAAQALMLLQLPAAYAPRTEQAQAFAALRGALSRCAGGQLARSVALDHALFTGRPFLHTLALSDLNLAAPDTLGAAGTRALVSALAAPDAPPSLAISASFPALQTALVQHYEFCANLPALALPTGYALDPTRVYRRRDVASTEPVL
jgi:4-amino-4-deoxy-L-arabinose transferase-like glycosyltransferase